MPKKDTESAVLGMLSSVGEQTRRPSAPAAPRVAEPRSTAPVERSVGNEPPASRGEEPEASISQLPPRAPDRKGDDVKRTVRLRGPAAVELRNAWLEAKRDDVLLTIQDFASDLVEDALARRRRRRSTASSS
jgi:hypothetical protein